MPVATFSACKSSIFPAFSKADQQLRAETVEPVILSAQEKVAIDLKK
jgi:hypothetical protein